MNKPIFMGSATALITPMLENGDINFKEFEKLIEFQIENGSDALVICGTTGEGSTLSDDEKYELVSIAVQLCKNRIPVIAGSGCNDTKHSTKLSERLSKTGASALLVITPYYNKTTQKGLIEHYNEINKATDLPIIVYNVPSRTGMTITPETYCSLSELSNICAIKEASSDLASFVRTKSICKDRLYYYCGNDDLTLPFLALGASGVISVLSNVFPRQVHDICEYYFTGKQKQAAELQLKFSRINSALSFEVNPIPIKAAVNMLGFNVGRCRLPLTTPSAGTYIQIENELKRLVAL